MKVVVLTNIGSHRGNHKSVVIAIVMTDYISCPTHKFPLRKLNTRLTVYCETESHNKSHMKNCSLSPTYSIPKIKTFAQL